MTKPAGQPPNFYSALTGIRAIAAYMVFIHHENPVRASIFGQRLHDMADELHIGVTLFFVLSGFLITDRYFDREDLSLRTYFVNRFARIYPMFFILVSALYLSHAIFKHERSSSDLVSYLMSITLLKGLFSKYLLSGISPSWSLTVEEIFYFSAPWIFILLRRSRWYLASLPFGITALGLGLVYVCQDLPLSGFLTSYRFMFWYTFFGRSAEFFAGIGLALFLRRYQGRIRSRYITYIGLTFIIFSLFALSSLRDDSLGRLGIYSVWGIVINNLLLPVFGVTLLFWGLITERTLVQRILSTKGFILLGQSSYVFYLIHLLVIHSLGRLHFIGMFLVANIVAIILYKLVEQPVNRRIRIKTETPASV